MFNSIRGMITAREVDAVHVDTGSVEWDISVSGRTLASLPPVGQTARVFLWLLHRDDQMKLFGFADDEERSLFLDLMKVDGVGPKQAMKILSGIASAEFEAALEAGDVDRLTAVPGLGTKTAQKIVLALKGKLSYSKKQAGPKGAHDDLVVALADMGYEARRAAEVLDDIDRTDGGELERLPADDREKELFRRAIVALSDRTGR